jgi:hypothetical protein
MINALIEMINEGTREITQDTMTNMNMGLNFKVGLLLVLIILLVAFLQLKMSIDMMEIADQHQCTTNRSTNRSTHPVSLMEDHKVVIRLEVFHQQTALLVAGDLIEGLDMVLEGEVVAIGDEKL